MVVDSFRRAEEVTRPESAIRGIAIRVPPAGIHTDARHGKFSAIRQQQGALGRLGPVPLRDVTLLTALTCGYSSAQTI